MVQWLRLFPPSAGAPGSNPGQGIRPHMLQLKQKKTLGEKYGNYEHQKASTVLKLWKLGCGDVSEV